MTRPLYRDPVDYIGTILKRDKYVYLAARINWDGCDEYDAFRSIQLATRWVGEGREGIVKERSEVKGDLFFVYAKRVLEPVREESR